MIVEQRTYDFHPGAIPKFLGLYESMGARYLQARILGNLVGYYVTDLGPLNQTVHLWAYASLDDRAVRRAALAAEPVWRDFLGQIVPLLQRQDSKILMPTAFSPSPS
jgi:hypothetical protein